MRLNDLFEAPITGFTTVGDFDEPESISHPADLRAVTKEPMVRRIKKAWERTPYDFNLIFVNLPGAEEWVETGLVSERWIWQRLFEVHQHLTDDAINVVFTNNRGDERVSFTPWIIAHRLSHALSIPHNIADIRQGWQVPEMREAAEDILKTTSEVKQRLLHEWTTKNFRKTFFSYIGTMKSAREGRLIREGEFLHEVFTQYLLTGSVKFNRLDKDFYKQNLTQDAFVNLLSQYDIIKANELIEDLEKRLPKYYNDALQSLHGKIIVM